MTINTAVQNFIGLFFILIATGCSESKFAVDFANDSFDIWCGENPCAWKVEAGQTAPAPTWHRKAMGIRLMDDPTRISQVVEVEGLSCVLLSLQGDTSGDAVLHFQVDRCNDGLDADDPNIELADGNWKTVYREASLAPWCDRARIIIEKTGNGDAVVASVNLTGDDFCAENPPPTLSTDDNGVDAGTK